LKLKFQTVAENTAKNFRGLLYFAAPGRWIGHVLRHNSFLQEIFEGRMMGKRLEVDGEYRCYMI